MHFFTVVSQYSPAGHRFLQSASQLQAAVGRGSRGGEDMEKEQLRGRKESIFCLYHTEEMPISHNTTNRHEQA